MSPDSAQRPTLQLSIIFQQGNWQLRPGELTCPYPSSQPHSGTLQLLSNPGF